MTSTIFPNMSEAGRFMIYCVERYKARRGLTGRALESLFSRYRVWEYLYENYEALHVFGVEFLVDDIDGLIRDRRSAAEAEARAARPEA